MSMTGRFAHEAGVGRNPSFFEDKLPRRHAG
jgi:hypothetical protein